MKVVSSIQATTARALTVQINVAMMRDPSGRFDLIIQFTYLPPSYFEQNPKNCRTTSFYCIFCALIRFVKGANFCVGGQLLGGAPSF